MLICRICNQCIGGGAGGASRPPPRKSSATAYPGLYYGIDVPWYSGRTGECPPHVYIPSHHLDAVHSGRGGGACCRGTYASCMPDPYCYGKEQLTRFSASRLMTYSNACMHIFLRVLAQCYRVH